MVELINVERVRDPNFKESVFRMNQLNKNKTRDQADIEEYQERYEKDYNRMWRVFHALCVPVPKPYDKWEHHKAYINFESMERNLPNYLGHECDFLSQHLFRHLSNDCKIGRVYFKTWLDEIFAPLWLKEPRDKMHLVFKLLDTDNDGILKASDLTSVAELINIDSRFGREVQMLMDHYT